MNKAFEKLLQDRAVDFQQEQVYYRPNGSLDRIIVALIVIPIFLLVFLWMGVSERTTLKFYNLKPNSEAAFVLTVQKRGAKTFQRYFLPPVPYQHRLELRIPAPDKKFPIQLQYNNQGQTQCLYLNKRYGDWGQMDAIWVNSKGFLDAYTEDKCTKKGCSQDFIESKNCATFGYIPEGLVQKASSKSAYTEIAPINSNDAKRLNSKTST